MKKYFYSDGKVKNGPYSFEELKDVDINKETLVWFEGLEDWKPIKEIKELEELLILIPPPISTNEVETNSYFIESEEKSEDSETDNDNVESLIPRKRTMFSETFSFEGRIRRTEYGISLIIYFIIAFIINLIIASVYEATLLGLAYIPMFWFILAQGAKRCHDIGNSGWFQIIPFYVFWMLFAKGEEGLRNQYGINPKL